MGSQIWFRLQIKQVHQLRSNLRTPQEESSWSESIPSRLLVDSVAVWLALWGAKFMSVARNALFCRRNRITNPTRSVTGRRTDNEDRAVRPVGDALAHTP